LGIRGHESSIDSKSKTLNVFEMNLYCHDTLLDIPPDFLFHVSCSWCLNLVGAISHTTTSFEVNARRLHVACYLKLLAIRLTPIMGINISPSQCFKAPEPQHRLYSNLWWSVIVAEARARANPTSRWFRFVWVEFMPRRDMSQ
jgi:hypothetical protein